MADLTPRPVEGEFAYAFIEYVTRDGRTLVVTTHFGETHAVTLAKRLIDRGQAWLRGSRSFDVVA